jgi:hypothetical protein
MRVKIRIDRFRRSSKFGFDVFIILIAKRTKQDIAPMLSSLCQCPSSKINDYIPVLSNK